MAAQSIAYTRRQLSRARNTATQALAAPEGQQVALRILAPDMIAQCNAFDAADTAAQQAAPAAKKEVAEGNQAMTALASQFDQAREVTAAKLGISYEAASAFATPDDLLNAAEDLEAQLQNADPSWAEALLAASGAALETATREQKEGTDALKALQKAQLQREQAEGAMRPVLVRFRRGVRATFGSKSREYRELLDRRSRRPGEDPVEPEQQ